MGESRWTSNKEPTLRSPVPVTTFRHLPAGGLALALALGATVLGCNLSCNLGRKKGDDGAGAAAPAGSKTYRFAFGTNNSTDFWNIGEKGLQ